MIWNLCGARKKKYIEGKKAKHRVNEVRMTWGETWCPRKM